MKPADRGCRSSCCFCSLAADAAIGKKPKYTDIQQYLRALQNKAGAAWNAEATQLIQEIGNRIKSMEKLDRLYHFHRIPKRQYVGLTEQLAN